MRKKYIVQLTEEERKYLRKLISAGTAPARKLNRARILLKADVGKHAEGEALIDKEIAGMLDTRPRPPFNAYASASTRGDSKQRWNARCRTGCTNDRWTGERKRT